MQEFKPQTTQGPADRFKGVVHATIIFVGKEPSRARMASVRFEAGAHTAWHSHAVGQYIHVKHGAAVVQERGGEAKVLHPGDTVYTEPGVEHWHGATPDEPMSHLVMWEAPAGDDIEETTWLEHVADDVYGMAANPR